MQKIIKRLSAVTCNIQTCFYAVEKDHIKKRLKRKRNVTKPLVADTYLQLQKEISNVVVNCF